MPIHFAIIEGRAAFFDSAISGRNIPAGAIKITPARHAQLLDGQADGKVISIDHKGKPKLVEPATSAADRRAQLVAAVKREAARRIDAISPIWRQLNDLRATGGAGQAGKARFAQIDAIRAAADLIEADIASAKAADLAEFPITENAHWPEPA